MVKILFRTIIFSWEKTNMKKIFALLTAFIVLVFGTIIAFKLKTNDDEDSKQDSPKEKKFSGQKEFENFDEAPKILEDILQVRNNLFVRLVILLFTGVFSTLITVANDFAAALGDNIDRRSPFKRKASAAESRRSDRKARGNFFIYNGFVF